MIKLKFYPEITLYIYRYMITTNAITIKRKF